jgi:hypothetical protein
MAAALWLAPSTTLGAALGKLNVLSRLGEPLNAEIDIMSLQPDEAQTLSAQLAARDAHARAGLSFSRALSDMRLSIERRSGRPVVRVRTSRAVEDPYLQMLVELRSSTGRVASPYTVLLDPRNDSVAPVKPQPAEAVPAAKPAAPAPAAQAPAPPVSRDELFGLPVKPAAEKPAGAAQWRGFVQNYTAYDYKDPSHWSRAVIRTQLGTQGGGRDLKWKATARLDLDPVYAGSDFYAPEVRRDQRADFFLRETYVDIPAGGLELRLGKQNIVWGEMVGLFFADVVSARDQRDFILPDFEIIRIPQWAVRAEHFGDGYHAEAIWLPVPEVDTIGKPGAEFYPFQVPPPAGFAQQFNNPVRPPRNTRNANFGLRASTLQSGWDISAFYYRSTDVNPTFYREVVPGPAPTLVFTPRHERIWQAGGTLAKDLGVTVLKAEAIYASGRKFNVTRLDVPGGVVAQDTLDYVVGLDFTLGTDTRLNLQYFQQHFFAHDPDLVLFERNESGVTLLLGGKIAGVWEPELLVIQSLNRRDRLLRPRLGWIPERNWRVTFGVDVFTGPPTGFFGRFDGNDRAYIELRRDF